MQPSPSRRAFLAAAPAFAAIGAGTAQATPAGPLHIAITRQQAARAAIDAWTATTEADIPRPLLQDEWDTLDQLVAVPCATDTQFVAKLRELARREEWLNGRDWIDCESPYIAMAIDHHLQVEA